MSLGTLFKAPGASSPWQFAGERLPRGTFQAMQQAEQLLREAQADAQQLRAQAAAEIESRKQQAFEQGYAAGQAEGMAQVLGTVEVERRLRELMSGQLADVVEHVLRGVLADLGEPEVMRQRVLRLLATAGDPSESSVPGSPPAGLAMLHVHPDQVALAQDVVSELKSSEAAAFAGLKVVPDPHRAFDALLLETRVGFIESSLELSLQAARALLQQALAHATRQWDALT